MISFLRTVGYLNHQNLTFIFMVFHIEKQRRILDFTKNVLVSATGRELAARFDKKGGQGVESVILVPSFSGSPRA